MSAQPASDVVIDVSSGDTGEVTVSPTSLTFTSANWNTPQTVTVTGVDDALLDGTRNTGITLSVNDAASDDAFDPLSNQTVIVSTLDDELPEVTLSVSATFGTEAAGTVITVTATATGAVIGDQTVDIAASGTGITGTDYTLSTGTITILDGQTTGTATFTIQDDGAIEGAETATLTISNPSAGITLGTTTARNVSITDNDIAGYTYAHSGGNTIVSETGTTDAFTVVLSAQPASDVVIEVSSGDTGEATVSPASLTFTAANWNTPQTITVTGVDDALLDGTRNTGITLSINDAASDDAFDPLSNQTVIVSTLDDELPEVSLSVSAAFGTEAAGTVITVTATATGAVTGDQTVDITASGTGITGTDYTLSAGSITILDGLTTGTATFTILDDAAIEGAETATLTISNPSAGLTLGATTSRNISITDNDTADVTLSVSTNTASETDGTVVTITATSSVAVTGDQTVDIAASGAGITGTDYSLSAAAITILNGTTTGTATFTILDDADIEGTETATLTISNPSSGLSLGVTTTQNITITDNEIPTVNLTINSASVGEAGNVVVLTVTADVAVVGDQTVDVAVTGAGVTGTDYAINSATITILNGQTSGVSNVTLQDDSYVEGTETATFTISNPSAGIVLGTTTSQNLDILDDDVAGLTIIESDGNTTVSETGTTDEFTVRLSSRPTSDVIIDISSGDTGEATISPSSLTFTQFNWNLTQTVTITGVSDAVFDGDQNTTITLSVNDASSNDFFDPMADQTVTVTTTEAPPAVNLSVSSNTGTEEDGTIITVIATAARAVVGDQIVDIAASGTRITGTDYILSAGSINILNGETTGSVTFTIQDDALGEGNETATLTITNPSGGILLGTTTSQDVMITDNDPIEVNLSANANSGSEIGTVITLQVTAAFAVVGDQTVDLSVSGTDITFTDYALINPTITILDGQTSNTISFTIQDDTYVEDTETATITMGNPSAGLALGAIATLDITIIDNDVAGFNITESDGNTSVSETGTTDDFLVKLDRRPTSDVVIDISSGDLGEATVSPTQLTFTINTWNTAQTVTVTGVDDNFVDGDQNTTITLSINDANSNDLFDPVADQTLTVTTIDDDAVGFTVAQSDGNTAVSETGTTDEFTVVLSAQPASDVIIDISSGDTGEATVSHASLTFTAANWNAPQTIIVTGVDDALVDGNQNTTVTLSINDAGSDDSFDLLADQTIMVTTVDDDTPGFTIVESDGSTEVSETGTIDNFTVVLNSQPTSDVLIDVSSGDLGEATVSPTSLTFTTANWNTPQTIIVTGIDDALVDGNQTTNITLSINDGSSDDLYDPLADQVVSVITTDNDFPEVNLSVSANTGSEASGTVITVTATASAAVTGDQIVDLAVSGTGITGTDYSLSAATITILNGATTGTVTFTILDDVDVEGTETATLTISNPSAGITLGATTTQDITITDNDVVANPTVELSVSANAGTEAAGTVITVTATASAAVTGDQTVDIAVSGTGITGTDYSLSPATITILNGVITGTATFTILDDVDVEGTETATLTISNPSAGITLGATTMQDITITDNDVVANPTVELSVSANTGTEAAGTVITVTATASAAVTGDQTVDIAVSGTGITGTDYSLSPATITILNGVITGTATFTILDDVDVEGTETATLTISNPSAGITLGATTMQDITITDNDVVANPTVELSVSANTGSEASGTVITVTATASAAVTGDQIVDLAVSGTGITGTDYSLSAATITILNGATTGTVTFTILDDVDVEGTETATLTISNPSAGITLGATTTQGITITDNDVAANPTVELSVSANAGTEAAGTVITVTATASAAVTGDQTVDIAVSGTGITGTDYSLSATTITILNGTTTGTATFTIVDDTDIEGTETATLTISNPSAGITLGATATQNITITDNDVAANPTVELSVSANAGTEAAGTVITVTATASATVTGDQTVDLTVSGTGITGTDYSLSAATITILNGATTGTATFTILDDADVEGTETATLTISNPSARITLSATTTQGITITDNDVAPNPTVELSVSANAGTEAAGTVITVTATASAAVTGDQTIDLSVSGTGITGTDYSLSATTITILNGTTTGTATFTIVDDTYIEGTETATLIISNPSAGITLGATTTKNVVITDNDFPEVSLSVSTNNGSEKEGTMIIVTATASSEVVGGKTVDLGISGAGITSTDYAISSTILSISNGETSGTAVIMITDDSDIEGIETMTLTISNPSEGIVLGTNITQDIVIEDDDYARPDPANSNTTITASPSILVADGVSTSIITVILSNANGDPLLISGGTVTLTTTGSASLSAVVDNTDGTYTATLTNTVAEDVTITGQVNGEDITNNALVIFTPDLTDSDGDGVIDSDEDTNGNGDLTDDDTDDDGIPNYLDPDDDGDGVPTKDEDVNKDGDPTNDDTDGDGVPNHLDEDDDGDGKSTEEEGTGDSDGDGTPDYLDTVDKVEASQILSPNGDGINDVFILKDIEKYPENMVSIFNRKGNLVFEIQGYNNNDKAWRGFPNTGFLTNGDRIVPNGTYFYVVDLKDGERPITGFFVLKR
ncbi:Calx-beta domain-containing protein [Roseivirga ehrenbergii]|uniref:Calx-beta domain-containing protein n=3 Tax=Roseivirga ehrenbergii (strain DSM 102268 / JCM 13514 / KCTC 12282 / NCIMB 14502 / KMM 6017) TaxID=279360 RepID=UPI001C875DA8|nr:Calx-beta domain-containing protein [Roseivirga ehrenbergii]